MNLIPVYVAVGAISFVKCELSVNSPVPFQNGYQYPISTGGWNGNGEASEEQKAQVEKDSVQENSKLYESFHKIKNIYLECQGKVNRRYNKIKVKSRVLELKNYLLSLYLCVKVYSFRFLDELLNDDFIPVTDYAYFVKDGLNFTEETTSRPKMSSVPMKDFTGRVLGQGWTTLVGERIENLFRTHSLKFQIDRSLAAQGRGRRRDHRMFAMMVMGFMIMASILIPMGFQFLTVLGGKSLLLAKMALIMSAINGLKKIATSNVGYGFYHTGSDGHHHDHLHHGFHEKHFHANPSSYGNLQGYN